LRPPLLFRAHLDLIRRSLGFIVTLALTQAAVGWLLLVPVLRYLDGNERPYASGWVREIFLLFPYLAWGTFFAGVMGHAIVWFVVRASALGRIAQGVVLWAVVLPPLLFCEPETAYAAALPGSLPYTLALGISTTPPAEFWSRFKMIRVGSSREEAEAILGPALRVVELGDEVVLQYVLADDGGWRLRLVVSNSGMVTSTDVYYWLD
jgi:hypothetical protein